MRACLPPIHALIPPERDIIMTKVKKVKKVKPETPVEAETPETQETPETPETPKLPPEQIGDPKFDPNFK